MFNKHHALLLAVMLGLSWILSGPSSANGLVNSRYDAHWPKDRTGCVETQVSRPYMTIHNLICGHSATHKGSGASTKNITHPAAPNDYNIGFYTLNCMTGQNAYSGYYLDNSGTGYARYSYYYYPPGGGVIRSYADDPWDCGDPSGCDVDTQASGQSGVEFTSVTMYTYWPNSGYFQFGGCD